MSTYELEHAVLRETKNTFTLSSFEQDTLAIERLIGQAKKNVNIYSHTLCPAIFNNQKIVHACEAFCIKNPYTQLNILVSDSRPITRISHALLGLSHRLPSSIEFKVLASDISPPEGDFVCIDRSAYFQLSNHQHYAGICNFSDAGQTATLLSFFKDAWERSEIDSELRSLLI